MDIFPLRIRADDDLDVQAPQQGEALGIEMGDSMTDAARKILVAQFERMLDREKGALAGKDAEELHGMRVAIEADAGRDAGLLRTISTGTGSRASPRRSSGPARRCGSVRDLNVFKSKTESYLDSLALFRRRGVEPLLAAWREEHEARLDEMRDYLKGRDYSRFKERFREFLETPDVGGRDRRQAKAEPAAFRVRHVLPALLFSAYARLRAFDECFAGNETPLLRYHQLRIAAKRLRYTLEFFIEPWAPRRSPHREDEAAAGSSGKSAGRGDRERYTPFLPALGRMEEGPAR